MDRKVALAAAAAVVLTVSAGTAAVAANLGLLSATADDTVGQLQPARDDRSPTDTIVIEEIVPAGDPIDDDVREDDGYDDDEDHFEDGEDDDRYGYHDDGHDDDD